MFNLIKSGTTGNPKGAMISHSGSLGCISSFLNANGNILNN